MWSRKSPMLVFWGEGEEKKKTKNQKEVGRAGGKRSSNMEQQDPDKALLTGAANWLKEPQL